MSDDGLVELYLTRMPPVVWLGLLGRVTGERAKRSLSRALFTDDDSLRDLRDPNVRARVADCILHSREMKRIIRDDIDALVAEIKVKAGTHGGAGRRR